MVNTNAERNPIDALAEEFAERYRRGERPSLTEYTRKYPELAAEIQELFPALAVMEQLKPVAPDASAELYNLQGKRPERIGDFRILREIGRGGMGIVFEAEQVSLGRHVALKVLPTSGLNDPIYLERFRREAKAAARLHHTNIVPVFGVGESQGALYYAMQFIHGEALDKVLRDVRRMRAPPGSQVENDSLVNLDRPDSVAHSLLSGRFTGAPVPGGELATPAMTGISAVPGSRDPAPDGEVVRAPPSACPGPSVQPAKAQAESDSYGDSSVSLAPSGFESDYCRSVARVGLQVAEGLAYAHRQGILHRDIKPSNLLLDVQGTVWITDFGLAKSEGAGDLTHTGDIVGTVRYMAPERFDGDSLLQSDVYGLGVTLYEMLTLRPAFDDTNKARLIERIAHHDPLPPRKLDPRIGRDLETIVLKCIARNPGERYTMAEQLAEDLRRFLSDRPILARRSPARERVWRWCKRNPGWAAAVGLLFIIAAGASVLSLQLLAALGQTQKAEAEVESKLYQSRVAEARAKSLSRRSGQRFESLALLDLARNQLGGPAVGGPQKLMELRNATLGALVVPDIYPAQLWAGFPPGSVQVDFDDRLEVYARTDQAGNCSIRRVVDDHEMYSFSCGGGPPRLSRDGRFIAIRNSDGRCQIWQLNETEAHLLLTETTVTEIDFHPNRALVAFSHSDGSLTLYDLAPVHKITPLSPNTLTREVVIALHPSQPWVAVSSYFAKIVQVRDWNTGAMIKTIEMPEGCSHLAWHPAGFLAASEGDGPNIQVFDRATFQRQKKFGPIWGGSHIFFNHAGDRLAAYAWDSSIRLFDFVTEQLLVQLPYTASTLHLRFSADDRRLAGLIREGKLGIWEIADGREYRTLTHHAGPQTGDSAAMSPDGRLLAVTLTDGIGLWDLASGSKLAFVPMEQPSFVQFDRQGALMTRDRSGVYRWPIHNDPGGERGGVRFGPPSPVSLPPGGQLSQSRDSRVLAVRARAAGSEDPFAGAWVLDRDNHENLMHLAAGTDIWQVSVSPDGAWLVLADFPYGGVTVWEARTGRLKRTLLERSDGRPCFSPDGRWLAVGGANGGLFATGSWEQKRKLATSAYFAPASPTMVVETGTHVLRLEDTLTGQEIARLEDPNLDLAKNLVFTPDGTRLVVITPERRTVHVWNLRLLREQLALRGLDWEAPPYPPVHGGVTPPARQELLQVHFDMGDFDQLRLTQMRNNYDRAVQMAPHIAARWYYRSIFHREEGRSELAIADLKEASKRMDKFKDTRLKARCCNDLARLYATAPEKLRKKEDAVALAERAVKLQGGQWDYHNTLGIAYYRAGRYTDAVAELEKSLHGGAGHSDAFNLYFLAMAFHRLGQSAKASECYSQAVARHEAQKDLEPAQAQELKTFRSETARLLGLPDK
jgi:eukaryotic-like serine/threonine-protein kinase